MGYYTDYTVTVDVSSTPQKEQIANDLADLSGYGSIYDCITSNEMMNCKWYECQDHMREISKRYSGILFTVTGDGEDSDDVWLKYYLDGKCQDANARVVFDDFDMEKLL